MKQYPAQSTDLKLLILKIKKRSIMSLLASKHLFVVFQLITIIDDRSFPLLALLFNKPILRSKHTRRRNVKSIENLPHRSILSIVVGCCKIVCCPDISTTHCVPSSSSVRRKREKLISTRSSRVSFSQVFTRVVPSRRRLFSTLCFRLEFISTLINVPVYFRL